MISTLFLSLILQLHIFINDEYVGNAASVDYYYTNDLVLYIKTDAIFKSGFE